ncbi:MAG: AEC family transporter [Candidatus Eisenbacteria bacterium]|nr:AEC family transporter [Candidatus Eisenbacteria bacterium]
MLLLRLFIDNLLPAFLAAGSGSLVAWRLKIPVQPLARVALYVFSPCLIFKLVMSQPPDPVAMLRMAGFALTALPIMGLLGYLVARLLKLSRSMTAAMILVVLLPNSGNFGLAVNLFAFGEEGLAQAGLFFIVSALFSYSAGVLVAAMGKAGPREAALSLLKVPALWAALVAFIFLGLGWKLPNPIHRAVDMLADASIPLFLVILGMQLVGVNWKAQRNPLVAAVALRLVASVGIAFLMVRVWDLDGAARQAAVFQAAMPTAVITSVLTSEYEGEAEFVSSVILLTTILSPLTLTPLMALLGAR